MSSISEVRIYGPADGIVPGVVLSVGDACSYEIPGGSEYSGTYYGTADAWSSSVKTENVLIVGSTVNSAVESSGASFGLAVSLVDGTSTLVLSGSSEISGSTVSGVSGTAIRSNGYDLRISGSTFANNISSTTEGGAVNAGGTAGSVVIEKTVFSGNRGTNGGAIRNYRTMSISGSTFSGNSAIASDTPKGGAIYTRNGVLTLGNVVFDGNSAEQGGAIYVLSGTLKLAGEITLCQSGDTIYNQGGSVQVDCSALLDGGVYRRAVRTKFSSAYMGKGSVALDDTTNYTKVEANNDLFVMANGSDITWAGFISRDGGVYDMTIGDVYYAGGAYTDYSADSAISVGGASQSVSALILSGATVHDAYSTSTLKLFVYSSLITGTSGSALTANDVDVVIDGSTFSGNSTSGLAGAFNAGSTEGTVTITKTLFDDNEAGSYGGAIRNYRTMNISGSTFSGNHSASDGGAIYTRNGVLTLGDAIFDGNSAARGGAIFILSGAVYLSGTITLKQSTDTIYYHGGTFRILTRDLLGYDEDKGAMTLNVNKVVDTEFDTAYMEKGSIGVDDSAYATFSAANDLYVVAKSFGNYAAIISEHGDIYNYGDYAGPGYTNFADADTSVTVSGSTYSLDTAVVVGTVTVDGGMGSVTDLLISTGAVVNFATTQSLADIALTVDGSAYAGGTIIVATGVSAIGDYTITDKGAYTGLKLVSDAGTLYLTDATVVPTDTPQSSFIGGTNNLMTGGTITGAYFGTANASGDVLNVITGGTIGNAVIGGAKVTKGNTASLGTVTLNISGDACIVGGTANGGMLYTAGYAYGKTAHPTGTDSEVALSVVTSTLNLSDGFAPVENLYSGAHARQGARTQVTSTEINVSGGTYGRIYGGGWGENYGRSEVGGSTISVTGGTLGYIYAGGGNAANGTSVVSGNVTIDVSGSASVGIVFLAGKNQNCSIDGNVTMTVSGSDKTMTRISGWNANGDNNTVGTTTLDLRTSLDVEYLDHVDVVRIAEGETLNVSKHLWYEGDVSMLIDFDLDGALDTDWTAMSGDGMEVYQAAQYTIDGGAVCRWDSVSGNLVYVGGGDSGYGLDFSEANKVKFVTVANS